MGKERAKRDTAGINSSLTAWKAHSQFRDLASMKKRFRIVAEENRSRFSRKKRKRRCRVEVRIARQTKSDSCRTSTAKIAFIGRKSFIIDRGKFISSCRMMVFNAISSITGSNGCSLAPPLRAYINPVQQDYCHFD